MRSKNLVCILLVSCLGFISFSGCARAGGFGISPPQIVANNLLRGSEYEQVVYFVQSEPDQDLQVDLTVDAPKIKDWISIDRGASFILPKNQQQFPVTVKIKVPENAELGKYEGHITISTKPSQTKQVSEGSSVSINLGGRIDLDLTVGNDIVEDFEVLSIDIKDIEPGWPMVAIIKVENRGNVPVMLDSATFDLFDKYNSSRLGFGQTDKFEEVAPYSTKEMVLKFPIDVKLGLGEYSGTVRLYKNDKIVKELKTPFDIVAEGTLPYDYGNDAAFAKSSFAALMPYLPPAAAVVALLLLGYVIHRRRKKKDRVKPS
jgi:hypothetical protein